MSYKTPKCGIKFANCSDCGCTWNGCPDDENDYDKLYHSDIIYDEMKDREMDEKTKSESN